MLRTSVLCLTTALISLGAVSGSVSVSAQVTVDSLQPAALYDAGTLDAAQGGLGPQLWQGTSAARATELIKSIDVDAHGTTLNLIKTVLLSAGTPPQTTGTLEYESYVKARLSGLLALNAFEDFQTISERSNLNTSDSTFTKTFTEHALLSGQTETACQFADGIQTGRKAPYWAKLRAYCHFTRDELPAAELTADLVKRSDHEDATFFALLGNLTGSVLKTPKPENMKTPLHMAMAKTVFADKTPDISTLPPLLARTIAQNTALENDLRLGALVRSAHILTSDEIGQVLNDFADLPSEDISSVLESEKPWSAKAWGEAYLALRNSTDMGLNTKICAQILSRAETLGILGPISKLLASDTAILPHNMQAVENPSLFARQAVQNRDIGALQALFQNLEDGNPLRGRIALAADALGNGFMLTDLGVDIEARLARSGKEQARAVRDSYIAVSLGAKLSDTALNALMDAPKLKGHSAPPAALLALGDAAKRRAQAETVLRAAEIISSHNISDLRVDSLSAILSHFNDVGLNTQAGQLAALDFLHGY